MKMLKERHQHIRIKFINHSSGNMEDQLDEQHLGMGGEVDEVSRYPYLEKIKVDE